MHHNHGEFIKKDDSSFILEKWLSVDTRKEVGLYESQPIYQCMNHRWEKSQLNDHQWKNSSDHWYDCQWNTGIVVLLEEMSASKA